MEGFALVVDLLSRLGRCWRGLTLVASSCGKCTISEHHAALKTEEAFMSADINIRGSLLRKVNQLQLQPAFVSLLL